MSMSGGPSPPPVPSAQSTAEAQMKYSTEAAQEQQRLNMVDQQTQYGSLDYQTTIDPVTGKPSYSATSSLSPEQQALLNFLQGSQTSLGQTGGNLAGNVSGLYSSAPDLIGTANSETQLGIDRELPYMERFMKPAREQKDTELRNQGILPGTPAYQQQMDALTAQQDLDKGNWMNTYQGQAFNQAQAEYQIPLDTLGKVLGLSQPADLKSSLVGTPTTSVQTPDYNAAVKNQQDALNAQYQAKVQSQNAMMSAILGGATSIIGMPAVSGIPKNAGGIIYNSLNS